MKVEERRSRGQKATATEGIHHHNISSLSFHGGRLDDEQQHHRRISLLTSLNGCVWLMIQRKVVGVGWGIARRSLGPSE